VPLTGRSAQPKSSNKTAAGNVLRANRQVILKCYDFQREIAIMSVAKLAVFLVYSLSQSVAKKPGFNQL
jgi:hypothetical protein